jgi:hypothetical protein
MLLLVSAAFAGPVDQATLDAPVPVVHDLDLMPESGTWPCSLTMPVDGLGALGELTADEDCPAGLNDTALALGKGWHFLNAPTPHTETAVVAFHVLGMGDPEPKPETTRGKAVYLLRPLDVADAPTAPTVTDAKGKASPAWTLTGVKAAKLSKAAEAAGVVSGTCLLRLDVGPDGAITKVRATRCLDVLAEPAIASVKKAKFVVAEGQKAPDRYDLAVRFEPEK